MSHEFYLAVILLVGGWRNCMRKFPEFVRYFEIMNEFLEINIQEIYTHPTRLDLLDRDLYN